MEYLTTALEWLGTMDASDCFGALSAIASAASAYAAFRTIETTVRSQRNEKALAYAARTLERAYTALTGDVSSRSVLRDRLAWLTSARLIEEYRVAKGLIKDKQLKRECESHEEHWRRLFYTALEPLAKGQGSYYAGDDETDPIAKISAVVVHAFATWPSGRPDPLDRYQNTEEAIKKLGVANYWFALKSYLGLLR